MKTSPLIYQLLAHNCWKQSQVSAFIGLQSSTQRGERRLFAQCFYEHILSDQPVHIAFREARHKTDRLQVSALSPFIAPILYLWDEPTVLVQHVERICTVPPGDASEPVYDGPPRDRSANETAGYIVERV